MDNMRWFVRTMKRVFGTSVVENEVSCEAYEFYREDLDDLIISVEHLEKLPDPLLFETFIYVEENGNEWVLGVVEEEGTGEKLQWVIIS